MPLPVLVTRSQPVRRPLFNFERTQNPDAAQTFGDIVGAIAQIAAERKRRINERQNIDALLSAVEGNRQTPPETVEGMGFSAPLPPSTRTPSTFPEERGTFRKIGRGLGLIAPKGTPTKKALSLRAEKLVKRLIDDPVFYKEVQSNETRRQASNVLTAPANLYIPSVAEEQEEAQKQIVPPTPEQLEAMTFIQGFYSTPPEQRTPEMTGAFNAALNVASQNPELSKTLFSPTGLIGRGLSGTLGMEGQKRREEASLQLEEKRQKNSLERISKTQEGQQALAKLKSDLSRLNANESQMDRAALRFAGSVADKTDAILKAVRDGVIRAPQGQEEGIAFEKWATGVAVRLTADEFKQAFAFTGQRAVSAAPQNVPAPQTGSALDRALKELP